MDSPKQRALAVQHFQRKIRQLEGLLYSTLGVKSDRQVSESTRCTLRLLMVVDVHQILTASFTKWALRGASRQRCCHPIQQQGVGAVLCNFTLYQSSRLHDIPLPRSLVSWRLPWRWVFLPHFFRLFDCVH